MPLTQAFRQRTLSRQADLRRHQRVTVNLLGRFMLEDRHEYPCQTMDMSPGGVAFISPVKARVGERIVAYIDHIGRIDGTIARLFDGGFALTINGTQRKKDKLAAKLTWLANRHELGFAEDRRHDRLVSKNPHVTVTLPDASEHRARILDLSLSGAALGMTIRPSIGSPVTVGRLRARVVRQFEEGIAVEFASLQTITSIEENIG